MNVRNMTMMIISMAIAVVIVTGVLVPVIADSMSDDSSGYTNTGDYYYKEAKEGENHVLNVDISTNVATISLDGSTLHTITLDNNGLCVPLLVGKQGEANVIFTLSHFFMPYGDPIEEETGLYLVPLDATAGSSDNSTTINITGKTIEALEITDLQFYISDTGDYVLSEAPVVSEEETIYCSYLNQSLDPNSDPLDIKLIWLNGYGTVSTIETPKSDVDAGPGIFGASEYNIWQVGSNYYSCLYADDGFQEGDITVNTTDTANGVKLNSISATLTYDNEQSPTQTVTISKFIVPVEVGEGGGSSMPSSIATVLPVIPLVVVIGIIMAGIGVIRMKE